MNFFFPVFAAVLQAGSFTLDKVVLSIRRITFRTYSGVSFPLLFVIMLGIFLIFRPPLSRDMFSENIVWLLAASILLSLITNLVFYRALDDDHLGEIQAIDLLRSIPVIVFSGIIFADERNFALIIPACVASLAVAWAHWERHHFKIARHTLPFLLWSLVSAPFGAALSKILLAHFNPISLELIRDGALALVFGPLFFRDARRTSVSAFSLLLATNILTAVAWLLFYFSYQRSGIVFTALVFSLQPLLVYLASLFFLKEPFERKKAIAFIIVLISIAVAKAL